jgi:hypothetical protein
MRSFLIRAGVAVVLLTVLWFFTSRWCSPLVDQLYTPRLATLQSTPLGWNGVWLQFGPGISNTMGPADVVALTTAATKSVVVPDCYVS